MPNLSFHGQRELSTGLQLQQKVQKQSATSNYCLTRRQVGAKSTVIPQFWTENSQMLSKNCYNHVKSMI